MMEIACPATILMIVAAPAEVAAIRSQFPESATCQGKPWCVIPLVSGVELVESGVGKANAAGAAGRVVDLGRHKLVVSLGIAGALPDSGLGLGDVIVASRSVFADEGVAVPGGFQSMGELGFGPLPPSREMGIEGSRDWIQRLGSLGLVKPIASVSTCSGEDGLARTVAARTGAAAEAMEGAAVGVVAARLGVPFLEVRVISNSTGDRPGQRWDLAGALRRLGGVATQIASLR